MCAFVLLSSKRKMVQKWCNEIGV